MKIKFLVVGLGCLLVQLSGCARLQQLTQPFLAKAKMVACAGPVIDQAFNLHNEAKTGFAFFYEERDPNRLFQAYYAAIDSIKTARSVKKCGDRNLTHFNALQNLEAQNRLLLDVIRLNMPDEDQLNLIQYNSFNKELKLSKTKDSLQSVHQGLGKFETTIRKPDLQKRLPLSELTELLGEIDTLKNRLKKIETSL